MSLSSKPPLTGDREGEWVALKFASGIGLGVDVGDFLEHERTHERNRPLQAVRTLHTIAVEHGSTSRVMAAILTFTEIFKRNGRNAEYGDTTATIPHIIERALQHRWTD